MARPQSFISFHYRRLKTPKWQANRICVTMLSRFSKTKITAAAKWVYVLMHLLDRSPHSVPKGLSDMKWIYFAFGRMSAIHIQSTGIGYICHASFIQCEYAFDSRSCSTMILRDSHTSRTGMDNIKHKYILLFLFHNLATLSRWMYLHSVPVWPYSLKHVC